MAELFCIHIAVCTPRFPTFVCFRCSGVRVTAAVYQNPLRLGVLKNGVPVTENTLIKVGTEIELELTVMHESGK